VYHKLIYLSLSQSYRKRRTHQIKGIRTSSSMNKDKDLTDSRIMGRIIKMWTLICQLFLATERANSPKSKFFDAVACPNTGVVEFSHLPDQSSQAWCHLRLSLLVVNERWEQMPIHPLRGNVDINQEPPLGRPSLGALEGGIDIFLSTVVTQ
jgi:hypothetical protein